jgi:hypothetical protein
VNAADKALIEAIDIVNLKPDDVVILRVRQECSQADANEMLEAIRALGIENRLFAIVGDVKVEIQPAEADDYGLRAFYDGYDQAYYDNQEAT